MTLLGAILIWCALSFLATGFCWFAGWRAERAENRDTRVITTAPVDVLFAANDHVGGRKWA